MDKLHPDARSKLMARVKNKNTSAEKQVRSMLFRAGLRFRLHSRRLPGSPDIVLPKHNTVVFVHGCFWHGHDCKRGKRPASNESLWNKKIDRNMERDTNAQTKLLEMGWRVEVIWTCRILQDTENLIMSLRT
ncbi:very short patch repair endonuclease [Mesorhizobium sp.]|uniref:very short patch repair endonuclease n=1 Tax=Mesorhizobium sp. TaxID=1871066 RepID=UPI000FEA7C32|nr:very short patch repair endonuclease [Mesorhizobium sp.]RWK48105.1 MAG: DNA mismatch endonuclease Vsr [Mesorhizobium sp.]